MDMKWIYIGEKKEKCACHGSKFSSIFGYDEDKGIIYADSMFQCRIMITAGCLEYDELMCLMKEGNDNTITEYIEKLAIKYLPINHVIKAVNEVKRINYIAGYNARKSEVSGMIQNILGKG
jgi:hypothetical protein